MVRIEDILERVSSYSPASNVEIIKKAYVFSGLVHQGQTRLSGEPYLNHPIEVAGILAGLKMDPVTVATGLLHDTVEDTHTTVEKIEEVFGREVALLVDGLTKISRISFERKADRDAENFRKMLLAMARDIRIILVKLADRLHNMRTLDALPGDRRLSIARETLDIYAPLANRLGIGWMKTELEDLAFKHLEPERYAALLHKVEKVVAEREEYVARTKAVIEEKLAEHGIKADVSGRLKHLYGIYRKMTERDLDFENVQDIIAFRIVVGSLKDCYTALGAIHSTWKPVPGRFKDYIGIPKPNLYQSLHTTVIGPSGERMEVQIRTEEMHSIAELGIAAHWKYKEGGAVESKDDQRFAWLRQLLEWQKDLTDSEDFLDTLKVDLFPEEVFVFTPKGDVKVLPQGATPVDFAYSIHTDVGHRCSGAKVNGRMVPLRHKLRNGNVVAIITSAAHKPSKDWLAFVVTSRARNRVRQWIKAEERERSIHLGREISEKEFKKHGLDYGRLVKSGEMDRIAREAFGLAGAEALQMNVGYGKVSVNQLLSKILPPEKLDAGEAKKVSSIFKVLGKLKARPKPSSQGVVVSGFDDMMVKFARCCSPLPGDEIKGFITHGQGVAVHAAGCHNLLGTDPERLIAVEWDKAGGATRAVTIRVHGKNEKGLLADMSNAIKAADANIVNADIRTTSDNMVVNTFEVEVADLEHLKSVIKALKKIKKVTKVERVGPEDPGKK